MGLLPARALRPTAGLTSRTCRDCVKRISNARSATASSGGSAAPVISSRSCRPSLAAPPEGSPA
eukprot:353138-Alexandrium_andersonii.AAC.1